MKIKDKTTAEIIKPSEPGDGQESQLNQPPAVDYTKIWNDGHKCFNSTQSRAFTELLMTEEKFKEKFHRDKYDYRKPRNPLIGDSTPRDGTNRPILNPAKYNTVVGSNFLFNKDKELERTNYHRKSGTFEKKIRKNEIYSDKIGVDERKYDVLGNTYNMERPQTCDFTRPETMKRPSTSSSSPFASSASNSFSPSFTTTSNFSSSSSLRPSTSSLSSSRPSQDPHRISFIDTLQFSQKIIQENNQKKKNEQLLMREFIENERNKRQSEKVKREMIYLQNTLLNKQKELEFLETIKRK